MLMAAQQIDCQMAIRPIRLSIIPYQRELFWIYSGAVSILFFLPNIPALIFPQKLAHVYQHAQSPALTLLKPYKSTGFLQPALSVVSGTGQNTPNLVATAPFGTLGVYRIFESNYCHSYLFILSSKANGG